MRVSPFCTKSKKLVFGDFVVGQTLNVTLEADSYQPLKIRVLDPGLA